MTQRTDPNSAVAVHTLEDLRAELSLMRHAIEGLTAVRERLPDYSPTLGAMSEQLRAVSHTLGRIEKAPTIALTPVELTKQIVVSAAHARAEDARKIDEVREALSRSIGRIDGIVERGQSVQGQMRRLIWCCVGSVVAGIVFGVWLARALAG